MSNDRRADDRIGESITPRSQCIRPWPLINPIQLLYSTLVEWVVVDIAESFHNLAIYIGGVISINQHVYNRTKSSWWAYKVHEIDVIHHRNKREAHHF
jgi:hypothetical protein